VSPVPCGPLVVVDFPFYSTEAHRLTHQFRFFPGLVLAGGMEKTVPGRSLRQDYFCRGGVYGDSGRELITRGLASRSGAGMRVDFTDVVAAIDIKKKRQGKSLLAEGDFESEVVERTWKVGGQ